MDTKDLEKWEHLHLTAFYATQAKDFAYKTPVGEFLIGLDDIIQFWGAKGFKLITVQPRMWDNYNNNDEISNTMVTAYDLFFRRPWID